MPTPAWTQPPRPSHRRASRRLPTRARRPQAPSQRRRSPRRFVPASSCAPFCNQTGRPRRCADRQGTGPFVTRVELGTDLDAAAPATADSKPSRPSATASTAPSPAHPDRPQRTRSLGPQKHAHSQPRIHKRSHDPNVRATPQRANRPSPHASLPTTTQTPFARAHWSGRRRAPLILVALWVVWSLADLRRRHLGCFVLTAGRLFSSSFGSRV